MAVLSLNGIHYHEFRGRGIVRLLDGIAQLGADALDVETRLVEDKGYIALGLVLAAALDAVLERLQVGELGIVSSVCFAWKERFCFKVAV